MPNEEKVEDKVETQTTGGDDQYGGASDEDISFAESAGWKPKEEYEGPEGTWVNAAQFAAENRKINKVVNAVNANLRKEIAEMRANFDGVVEVIKSAAKREYDEKIAKLEAERAEAIRDNDDSAFTKADKALREAERNPPKEPEKKATGDGIDPATVEVLSKWAAENQWFGTDKRKTNLAKVVAADMREERPELVGKQAEWLKELDRRLRELHPEDFGKKKAPVNRTEGGNGGGNSSASGSKEKGYNELPAAAKEQALKYEKLYKVPKEDYAKNYWEQIK